MMKKVLSVIALALTGCLLFASCSPQSEPSASSSANSTASAGATGSGGAGPTVPDQPVNWAPVIDADGTYHFGVGRTEFTGKLLTDFTDGTINTTSSYGEYKFEDGILKVYANGSFADAYDNITGGLDDGDYANAVYVGVRVHNNNDEPAWFGLQGDNIFLGEKGDDVIIAYDNGRAYATTVEYKTTRYCAMLPANFEGNILIPLSRLYSGTDMNASTAWTDNRTPWTKLGFHVNCEENNSVDFRYVFLTNETLPEVEPVPENVDFNITNPEYSYTAEQRITPFWTSNVMYNESLTMEENNGGNIVGKLLFVPTRIISVVDAKLQNEYKEGVDFKWIEGTNQIEWLEGSSIPYFYNGALSGLKENGQPVNDYPNWDSEARCRLAGVLYCADKFLWEKQIAVTYEYDLSQVEERESSIPSIKATGSPKPPRSLLTTKALRCSSMETAFSLAATPAADADASP